MEDKQRLPKALKKLRAVKGMSLRQVELKTGVSNSYLCQLENGKIKEPSPHILRKLARVYDVDLIDLMKLAGYHKEETEENVYKKITTNAIYDTICCLNDYEKEDVLEYIEFIRSKRKV